MLLITAAMSVVGLLDPDVSRSLTRDASLVRAGEWWRLATPILVQPDGWGQFAFNLAGIAIVGAAVERCRAPWLTAYLLAGVGSIVILTTLRPGDHGGGSSDCVAGLIGVLAMTEARRQRLSPGLLASAAHAYSAFFCCYLTGLALGGVWPAAVAGNVAVAVAVTARRRLGAPRLAIGLLVLVVVSGLVLTMRLDGHGIGLLTGLAVAYIAEITRGTPRCRRVGDRAP